MDFDSRVRSVLRSLRPGDVVSYTWVAAEAGAPLRARAVGRFLARDEEDLPWWRVVYADGRLSAPDRVEQERRLRAEGHAIRGGHVLTSPRHTSWR